MTVAREPRLPFHSASAHELVSRDVRGMLAMGYTMSQIFQAVTYSDWWVVNEVLLGLGHAGKPGVRKPRASRRKGVAG